MIGSVAYFSYRIAPQRVVLTDSPIRRCQRDAQ